MKQRTSSAKAAPVAYRAASLENIEHTLPAAAPLSGLAETLSSSYPRYRPLLFVWRKNVVGLYRMLKNGLLLCADASLFAVVVVGYLLGTFILFPWRRFRRRANTN